MKFSISRDALIKPLNLVAGVVERRQTLPILSNMRISVEGESLSLTGTDLEVELVANIELTDQGADFQQGQITVPGRKLVDICKALPDGADLKFSLDENKLIIRSGRSRFSLSTLPASDFPGVEQGKNGQQFELKQGDLKRLIDRTSFAMAQQDVRYYLNGMLFEVSQDLLRAVATDGHRLAMATFEGAVAVEQDAQVIVPRKGVVELARLLIHEDEPASLIVGTNHIRVATRGFTFTSKLIDGKFPDYERVLPRGTTKTVIGSREELKQAFARAAILSNEKYRGIRMLLANGALTITANNPEQEEAEETVAVDYEGPGLEIGFNVSYILDVLGVVSGEEVKFLLSDANSSALIEDAVEGDCQYVVMPMRL